MYNPLAAESSSTLAIKSVGRFSVALVLCTITELSVSCEVSLASERAPA